MGRGDDQDHLEEYRLILQSLKGTAEGLLVNQVSNVWNIYGGLNRLHNVMEKIFKHGCRVFDQDGDPDCWIFIQGLSRLQPSLSTSLSLLVDEDSSQQLPPSVSGRALIWLYKSLEGHTLSQKLFWLLSDKAHLLSCFEASAYLCQEKYGEATLICLKAVEQNLPALLTEIDPCLYLAATWPLSIFRKTHRKSRSLPEARITDDGGRFLHKQTSADSNVMASSALGASAGSCFGVYDADRDDTNGDDDRGSVCEEATECTFQGETEVVEQEVEEKDLEKESSARQQSSSLPNILITPENTPVAQLSNSCPNSPLLSPVQTSIPPIASNKLSPSMLKVDYSGVAKESEPPGVAAPTLSVARPRHLRLREAVPRWSLPRTHSVVVGSAPASVGGDRRGLAPRKSFLEGGGANVLPMATGFFPRPQQGQSLASFLSSGQFSRPSAELDRENAHFSVCEAMIAAIELVKCNQQVATALTACSRSSGRSSRGGRGGVPDESDEEANPLKQRIRLRRRQRPAVRTPHTPWGGPLLLSDGRTDTTTTDQSVSPPSSSPGSPSESISTDGVDDLEVDEVQNLSQLKHSGLSVSMASLYSEADLSRPHVAPAPGVMSVRIPDTTVLTESVVSAEGVALSLLRQFSDKQLPRASELQWLVSEQDAPQQLLPLPTSWPVSPDEAEATPLRGTADWAPPRPQVIFTPHPTPVRRVLMAKQNYRCAGCGMKVALEYAHRFRYCEYLGRFFCTGCHANQLALIPGRVLSKWDFTRYPVSSFSYRLLDQMMGDPLFHIGDLNPALYRRARQLERTRQLRLQLFYLKDFIFACRFVEGLQEELRKESEFILADVDVYSLADLQQVRSGELPQRLRALVLACTQHVTDCPLCQARGFVCEICKAEEVIFPWQLPRVAQCSGCGACFHSSCWTGSPCPRCVRRRTKQSSTCEEETPPPESQPGASSSSPAV